MALFDSSPHGYIDIRDKDSNVLKLFFGHENSLTGSRRFGRMQDAVKNGCEAPPVDLRYLKRPGKGFTNEGTSSVVSFLSEVYESIAETLPDYRDETLDVQTTLEQTQQSDGYGQLLTEKSEAEVPSAGKRKERGLKKLRMMKKSVRVNTARKPELGGLREEKWLPPGQMKDYWEMYKLRNRQSLAKCASFTTFWREPCLIFDSCFLTCLAL